MEIDKNKKELEGDFIIDIEEYCDKWCEKCLYTDKCKWFAEDKLMWAEIAEEINREKLIGNNEDMWIQMNNAIEEVENMIYVGAPLSDQKEDDEATIYFQEQLARAKDHKLTKTAIKFEQAVESWFEKSEDKILVFNYVTADYDFIYPNIDDEIELKKLFDSAEIIKWCVYILSIKVERAIMSYYLEEDGSISDWTLKDSDGSAMVALLSIDSALSALYHFNNKLIPEKENIEPIIRMLLWLRLEMEKMFPNAKDFVWPPKL